MISASEAKNFSMEAKRKADEDKAWLEEEAYTSSMNIISMKIDEAVSEGKMKIVLNNFKASDRVLSKLRELGYKANVTFEDYGILTIISWDV